MGFERARRCSTVDEKPLLSGFSVGPFCDTDERDVVETELLEHCMHLVYLAEASVDEQEIWRGDFAFANACVATPECLAKRAVVISWCDASDVEAAIFLLERTFRSEHDTGGDGPLPARMADIEAFDTTGNLRQIEGSSECCQHFFGSLPLREPHA